MKPLNPDQDHAVNFALERDGCNIFARPGKGKTRIALETIYSTGERTLVIAPLFPALTSWPDENKKWGFNFNMRVLHGKEKKMGSEDITVINYDALMWLKEQDLSSYKYIIYDEVHKLKNPGTKRFRNWRRKAQDFEFTLGLTGTPSGNHLKDLWGEMYVIDGGESLGTRLHGPKGFYAEFFYPHPYIKGVWQPKDGAKWRIFDRCKNRAISLDFYEGEMPELIHNIVSIHLPLEVRKLYEDLQNTSQITGTNITASNAGVRSAKLRQLAAGRIYDDDKNIAKMHSHKQKALAHLVDEQQGEPLIIFTQFKHDIQAIRDVLGDKVPVIDGRTTAIKMVDIVKQWNRREIPVLIAHPEKVGVGGNMQDGGNSICFYTLPWSLGDVEQAIGRVWRQGQDSDQCIVHYLCCVDTKDVDVIDAVTEKKSDQDDLFNALNHFEHKQ